MTQKTIFPGGKNEITVNASESIIISNYGGGVAQIFYWTKFANQPDTYILQQTLNNGSVMLGPFTSDQLIRINANKSMVKYNTGASPVLSSGNDAASVGGYAPSDIAILSEDETVSGNWSYDEDFSVPSIYSLARTNITDDGFISFNPGFIYNGAVFIFSGNLASVPAGMVYFRGTGSPAASIISAINDTILDVTTGALTGTTGTDTHLTLSVDTSGVIYIENRLGTNRSISGLLVGSAGS